MPTAHLTRAGQEPRIAWIAGSSHGVALEAADTEGRLSVMRSSFRSGAASPVHVHPDEDETLVLLTGSALIWAGPDRWEAGPGDIAFLPRALPHTYLVTSETAEVLTISNPAGMERFFRSAGWDLAQGPPPADWAVDREALQAAAAELGQLLLGPPLRADDVMPPQGLSWTAPTPR